MRADRVIATAVVSAAVFAGSARAVAVTPYVPSVAISEQIVATWRCEDQLPKPRTRPTQDPWKIPKAARQRRQNIFHRWVDLRRACIKQLHSHDSMVRTLNRGLAGTPMAGTGRELEAAGRRWHIHPAFIAAIAWAESTAGHQACSSNRYNAFGLASCGTWNGKPPPRFASWAEVYDFMARYLRGHTWVTSGWPSARTTYDFHGYAACSDCWGRKTAVFMRSKFGLGNSVWY